MLFGLQPVFLFAQDSTSVNNGNNNLFASRLRLQTGLFGISYQPDNSFRSLQPIVNCNYRLMMTNQNNVNNFHILDLVSEIGTNFIFFPYFKIGPELHLSENIYADFHGGVTYLLGQQLYPFLGAELGCIFKITQSSSIEVEGGFNALEVSVKYIAIGYSYK